MAKINGIPMIGHVYLNASKSKFIDRTYVATCDKKIYDYNFKMRMYFPETINRILIENNMHIVGFYGDYNLSDFNENSQKQIYICSIK